MDQQDRNRQNGTGALGRARRLTFASMVVERAWPLVLPLALVVAIFLALAWSGFFRIAPDALRLAAVVAMAGMALAALLMLRRFRLPEGGEIDRRIETANALPHAPVTALNDAIAPGGGAFADALWREHRRRMSEKLAGVEPDSPRTDVPRIDPWALRALAPLGLVAAFAFSLGPHGGSIADAWRGAAPVLAPAPRIDAWLTPPAYTRRPPVMLALGETATRAAPVGSTLALRLTGGSGAETLRFAPAAGEARDIAAAPETKAARAFADVLATDGAWVVRDGEREIGRWAFSVIPDTAPVVRFAAEPKRGVNGAFELHYTVEDDYGATGGSVGMTFAEAGKPGARPLYAAPEMALVMPKRGAKEPKAKSTKDLVKHPFAGGAVDVTLVVRDAAGNTGRSETKPATLPERRFTNPLARALIEQRRLIALDANAKRHVLDLMEAMTIRPADTIPLAAHYLGVVTAMTRLDMARSDDELRAVVDYLWTVAIGIEEGDLSDAEKALRQAQENLKNALENDASDEEIAKLMDELRKAMDKFLRELAEQAERNPQTAERDPDAREMRKNDIDRMMEQIEKLSKSGQKDKAKELLSQMQEMMENLQAGRRQNGQGQSAQNPMRKQMNKLGEIMRRQQELMNETDRMGRSPDGRPQRPGENPGGQQGQRGQEGGQGEGGEQQGGRMPGGQGDDPGGSGERPGEGFGELQDRQGQLRGEFGQLMDQLEGMGIDPGKGFGDAGDAMDGAGEALGEGERRGAVSEQGRALEAMRRGAAEMMRQMQQMGQGEQGGSQPGGQRNGDNRDPLGRPEATDGPDFGESVDVPDEFDAERARRILEAIRRRLGDALSPELERSYLERLLDMR